MGQFRCVSFPVPSSRLLLSTPRNANALLFHFSLCYRCKNKVHRSFNQAEKSYHDGRHSFLLQEKRFRVFQSFLPAPPLFYASSETRIIIVPLQPPFSISFHSLIIPTGMSSNRFRQIEKLDGDIHRRHNVAVTETVRVCCVICCRFMGQRVIKI